MQAFVRARQSPLTFSQVLYLATRMRNVFLFAIAAIVCLSAGCNRRVTGSGSGDYVKIDSLIAARITQMKEDHFRLEKTVSYRDTTIHVEIADPDLNKELAPFTRVIIPPVSWKNNYNLRTDTVDDRIIYLYESNDSAVDLHRFVLQRNLADRVVAMHFNYRSGNMFSTSDQFLIWDEDKDGNIWYRIEGKQHTRFFGEEVYKIEGKIISKGKD